MRAYALRFGVKVDGDEHAVEPAYEETIDALSKEDAIELAKDALVITPRYGATLVQLFDPTGQLVWQEAVDLGIKDADR